MSNGLRYLPYNVAGNFKAFSLEDGSNNKFGSIYLCTRRDLTAPSQVPAPAAASAYPPAPSGSSLFPDVFASLAHTIGDALYGMNRALLAMHAESMTGTTTPDAGQMSIYLGKAGIILGALKFMG